MNNRLKMTEIVFFEEKYRIPWDNFLLETPASVFEHQIGWKDLIEKIFGHRGYHLLAIENGDIAGVFPIYLVDHFIFGRFLISLPYCSSTGGILYRDESIRDMLLDKSLELANQLKVDYMEIRNHREQYHGLVNKDYYWTLTCDLKPGINILWEQLNKKTRYYIRKSYQSGFEIRYTMDFLKDFHDVYAENMRDLGSPAWKYEFLESIGKTFPDKVNLITIYLKNRCVGGILLFGFKEMYSDPWASSLRRYFNLFPNYLLYWEALKLACKNGYKIYDFGRSTYNSGTFFFKKRFGGRPQPVFYQFYIPSGSKIPDVDPYNPKYLLGIKLWKMLPLFLAKRLGHTLIKGIP
ncbi:MAG: hypothetical protein A2161_00780 [Candidatus Schekmanbacteria bacterium RBG_13_48_7]|uniref:BioF2-like acetyltransferase domain-containing protein n=1 Tax=Candidatus Schekmanbacteria bacterium RBG_13_48_7 TaxID=1817878 RepID=A0A1F7RUF3_9BACT|nr:MAG: hypothetical protein A2161_00780 [Candidatus Schekmanbacteria bacterium RBG_13_48_7]